MNPRALLPLFFLLTPAFGRGQDVPDPTFCSVSPADALNGFVLAPSLPDPIPLSIYLITVRNNANSPIAGASVVLTFGASTVLCTSTMLTGLTNASGQLTITLGGGGCAHNIALAGIVKANGVTIRSYENVKSPDYDGTSGNRRVDGCDEQLFLLEFSGQSPSQCHDYNNDGIVDGFDYEVFHSAFGHICDPLVDSSPGIDD